MLIVTVVMVSILQAIALLRFIINEDKDFGMDKHPRKPSA